jgi:ribosomal protein S18 acetylase RimI-like enzyme
VVEHGIVSARAPDGADDFARLSLIAAPAYLPALYAGTHERVHRSLFRCRNSLMGFAHTRFMQVDGRNAGMIVAYDWMDNKKEQTKTTFLIVRYMGLKFLRQMRHLQWAGENLGRIEDGTYYIAILGFYEEFRSMGLGTEILTFTQEQAKKVGSTRLDVDAETYNVDAIRFYKRFGMREVGELKRTTIGGKLFEFIRLSKDIK